MLGGNVTWSASDRCIRCLSTVFAVVPSQLVCPDLGFSISEGLPLRLWPVFKASGLSLGMMDTVGTITAHSLLLDGQGFPYLSEYCYYCVAGCYDQGAACVTVDDIGVNIQYICSW